MQFSWSPATTEAQVAEKNSPAVATPSIHHSISLANWSLGNAFVDVVSISSVLSRLRAAGGKARIEPSSNGLHP